MKKASKFVALSAAALLGLAGCATDGGSDTDTSSSSSGGSGSSDEVAEVTIFGGYAETDAANFQAALDEFGAANGIDITYTSLASFDTDIKVKIEAGQEPDIALWPQPGGLKDLADYLVPLADVFDTSEALGTLVPGWDQLAVVDGELYGLPVTANMKSLVFYNPTEFEANGLTVPTTEAELQALEAKIVSEGLGYPWCAGIESGGATGWAFTDWMEQYVLMFHGAEKYAQWIAGDLAFSSPEITQAAEYVSDRLLAEGQVNGGGVGMAATGFGETAPLFETGGLDAGQCFMMRQGSFIVGFTPDEIQAEVNSGDYSRFDAFPVPTPAGAQAGVIGGGDLFAVFDGHVNDAVSKVAAYIASGAPLEIMVSAGAVSPHTNFDSSLYPNDLNRKIGDAMAAAAVFGFDGSDQMPAEVNAEFWAAGTDYVAGNITWAEAAERIDSKY